MTQLSTILLTPHGLWPYPSTIKIPLPWEPGVRETKILKVQNIEEHFAPSIRTQFSSPQMDVKGMPQRSNPVTSPPLVTASQNRPMDISPADAAVPMSDSSQLDLKHSRSERMPTDSILVSEQISALSVISKGTTTVCPNTSHMCWCQKTTIGKFAFA